MSDEKKYTERDLIMAKRHAWAEGAAHEVGQFNRVVCWDRIEEKAAKVFPLPKVTRPRVVTGPYGVKARIDKNVYGAPMVVFSSDGKAWYPGTNKYEDVSPRIGGTDLAQWVPILAALLCDPTEEVEDV